jgi:hypothetical protein
VWGGGGEEVGTLRGEGPLCDTLLHMWTRCGTHSSIMLQLESHVIAGEVCLQMSVCLA